MLLAVGILARWPSLWLPGPLLQVFKTMVQVDELKWIASSRLALYGVDREVNGHINTSNSANVGACGRDPWIIYEVEDRLETTSLISRRDQET